MSYTLNAVTAPDAYSSGAVIEAVAITALTIDVANQAIYWQLKTGIGKGVGGTWEDTESYMLPGSRAIESDRIGEIVGIRFRAAIKAASIPAGQHQAVVSVRTMP